METNTPEGTGADEPVHPEPNAETGDAKKTPAGVQSLDRIPPTRPDATIAGKPVTESSDLVEVTDLTWESTVEKGKLPVAVMFYSPACVFCRQMEPHFRQFATDFKGMVLFVRLNILSNAWTPERYGVRSTPTFKFFCDGKPVQEIAGAVSPAILKRVINDVLVHGKDCARNSTEINYEITGYG